MRKLTVLIGVMVIALLLPTAAMAQTTPTSQTFTAELGQANDSGASATATIQLTGNTADIRIDGRGFFDGFPHAMHMHGEPGGNNICGPLNSSDAGFAEADEDGDGILSVVEGVPSYGDIAVSLTTEGDTSPDSGLDVDRFPTSGTLDYRRTIELPADVAQNLSTLHIVVHATDLNSSGEIGDRGIPSSLDPDLDIEATAPAACGQIVARAAGGVATGGGGTAGDGGTAVLFASALGLVALGSFRLRHRVNA